jgi:tetratricopeptide (TPR) repeat protein
MNKRTEARAILVAVIVVAVLSGALSQLNAQTNKGIELYTAWRFQDAEKVLRDALKADPRDTQAGYYLGLSVLMQDKHAEALEILSKVKEDQDKVDRQSRSQVPDEYQIQLALARTRLELKQNEEAWKNLEAAKKANADAADVYVYRGLYYLNLQNAQKAIKELEKAMSMDEKNAYARYFAGQAYIRLGNPAKAVDVLKEFLQLAPSAPEVEKAKALISALC